MSQKIESTTVVHDFSAAARNKIGFGRQGESVVSTRLEAAGWNIVEQNWRSGRCGEIDIIALDPDAVLIFIEVKTRRTRDDKDCFSGAGFDAVHGLKQHRIIRLALRYLLERGLTPEDWPCRFDVVVVHYRSPDADSLLASDEPEITHVKNAFHGLGW